MKKLKKMEKNSQSRWFFVIAVAASLLAGFGVSAVWAEPSRMYSYLPHPGFVEVLYVPAVPVYPVPVAAYSKYAGLEADPYFTALSAWREDVDRVGVLSKPSIPVAWKGKSPQVLYAWVGSHWYQMTARVGEQPAGVLRRNMNDLNRLVMENGNIHWQMSDVNFLIRQTTRWGYFWMGQVRTNR